MAINSEPDLTAALQLTDTLELADTQGIEPPADLADTMLLAASQGMRLLAEIATAHRAIEPARTAPAESLFRWGHLDVTRKLGAGRFGEVYAAWDPRLQREVALKLVRVRAGTLRWLDEARSLARVHHPNVLTIFGADLLDERAGLWTEQVRGRTLEQWIAEHGALDAGETARIGRDLAAALGAVHTAGLVHGDLKTSNVMIEDDSAADALGTRDAGTPRLPRRVVIMDFGTARLMTEADGSGGLVTTPLFAAPEVLAGGSPGPRSDVYALGVLLYRLLTRRAPVEAADLAGPMSALERGERTPIRTRRPDAPAPLAAVIERATALDPAKRYASAAELRDALARLLGERIPRFAPLQLAVTGAALLVAAVLFVSLRHQLEMRDVSRIERPPRPVAALAATPWWTSPRLAVVSGIGWNVFAADFDQDGRADVLASDAAYVHTQLSQGRAVVYRGDRDPRVIAPGWQYAGRRANDLIGAAVACAGDVNGDGFEDAVVQDPSNLEGGAVATGGALLFLGSPHGLGAAPARVLTGDTPGANFARHMAPAGDVNHDGFADVLVSEHNWNGEHRNQGRVQLYLGGPEGLPPRPSQTLIGEPMSGAFGWDERGVGDLNHDGYDDVIVGSAWWQRRGAELGAIHVFLGGPHGLSLAPGMRIRGDRDGDLMGNTNAVVPIGDVNGDGFGDVAVGVAGHDGRAANIGEVRVYLGNRDGLSPRPAWRVEGFGSSCALGFSLAPARDVNGDGLPDLLVSGYGFSTDRAHPARGAVFLYLGAGPKRLFERRPAWWYENPQTEALFGTGVDLADVDGDGLADVIVGAPHWRNGSISNGRVYVFRGAR